MVDELNLTLHEEMRRAGSLVMRAPRSNTPPAVARNWPEIRLKYVVLPAPFGPTIAVSVPA